ncbi:MAG: hypothetical protein LC624_06215 [Halobacteriales archaeon]|nr:hypothetical protein [Halobacteriales archaeon]
MRRSGLPLALLLLVLAAPVAHGQAACTVTAALDRSTAQLQPGQAAQFNLTVTDTSAFPARADVNLSAPSGGWQAQITPATSQVQASGNAVFAIAVVAPRTTTLPVLNLAIATRLTCQDPVLGNAIGGPATASNTLGLSLATSGTGQPGGGNPASLAASAESLGLLIILLAAAVIVAIALLLQKRGGVRLTATEPHRDMPPGGGASFPVLVHNRTDRAARVELHASDPPEGWRVLLPPSALELGPGEERTVQVVVRSPANAQPPTGAQVDVEARTQGEPARVARVTLRAFVVDPAAAAAQERPDVVVRDESRR